MLKNEGHKVDSSVVKSILIRKQHHSDRGRIVYEHEAMRVEELLRFIRDRGLKTPRFARPNSNIEHPPHVEKQICVKFLEAADKDRTFSRFADLPPELRERIYKFYLSEFPKKLKCPTQPPLARSCRLLRHEALPLFYKSTTFILSFERRRGHDRRCELRPCHDTAIFLETLPSPICKIECEIGHAGGRWTGRID